MKPQALHRIRIRTTLQAEEAVAALVETLFGQTPSISSNMEALYSNVELFLQRKPRNAAALMSRLRQELQTLKECGVPIGLVRVGMRRLAAEDWAESWKRHFKPFTIGQALLVKPEWSNRKPVPGQQVVIIDPRLSFGTGQHPTTRFCLEELVRCRPEDTTPSCLDIGTGSGVLAIAAAKLGYSPVVAFDNDPDAVTDARRNVRRNGVARKLQLSCTDLTSLPARPAQKFDVVCANLIFDLLVSERRRIAGQLKPKGALILAGVFLHQFDSLVATYKEIGFSLINSIGENEWKSGTFVRSMG